MGTEVRGETQVNPVVVAEPAAVPVLAAVSGPSAGRAFAVTRATTTVGRHSTNDLVIDDPRVSGTHLELTRAGDRIRVRDLESTNGTWMNGYRVFDVEIGPGVELTVGDSVLRVQADAEATVPAAPDNESFGPLVGRSPAMRELFATLERIAPKELTVLIQGETGTGKEEVARAIHAASVRARGPFIVIDATSLPETLAESLLFGHERGAFTGAHERRIGFFEAARGGTVFIDEIGELPALIQAKFLRVLERREVTRVGGNGPIPIDVRVVAATNRDLRNAIDKERFREDLYFRLAQVRVFVPPLRQRASDVPLICAKLLARAGSDAMLDVDALEYLSSMPWPGNVRELNNVLLRASALAQGGVIRRSDVAGEGEGFRGTPDERKPLDLSGTFGDAKERAIERFERAYLALLMKRCQGNLSAAARQADVARHHFRDLLKKRGLYGVSLDDE
ncbi:MAG: sigma 54-dependent Fis family transcriptional regulator [Labilithrix sp.]|nr:sigma 54-dependent Fis family transcriptional regulator [Labilithrix sp.]